MKRFLSGLFGRTEARPSSFPNSRSHSSSIQDDSENATRAQLVQVTMRDLLRKSGIPPGWIECQVQINNSRTLGQGLFVRLVIHHWDDRLMLYTFALQKALLAEIMQFEPKAHTWLQGVSWQLTVASTCPYQTLPHRDSWLDAPACLLNPGQATPAVNLAVPVIAAAALGAVGSSQLLDPMVAFGETRSAPATLSDSPTHLPLFELDVSAKDADAEQDLERLFAIRDNELAANDLLTKGYGNTEPAPL